MCPVGARFFPSVFPRKIVCHCLLIETSQRLILVDTGLGLRDLARPSRLGPSRFSLGPLYLREETAYEQVRALGYSPDDVTDIIPTHLDLDHAGGIQDFPSARVHIEKRELAAALGARGLVNGSRYRSAQLSGAIGWQPYDVSVGEKWNGFACVRELAGLPPEILLVSLEGHSAGHIGVFVDGGSRVLLHAGDAYYHHNELLLGSRAPFGLRLFQKIVHEDYPVALETQRRLGALRTSGAGGASGSGDGLRGAEGDSGAGVSASRIEIFCSHDPLELTRALRANSAADY